jgi:methylase of polypeptide subunit release factors
VRRAVETFVAALDSADREGGRALLHGLAEEHIYEAALTLMMRLVFLFFAEERDLLPVTNPVYGENYAVTTLHDQLREAANRLGEEVLERRYDAFPRLLATFRAVHAGMDHDLAALPAYGGDLFDPDRFAFLEGRAPGSSWRTAPAQPFPIHNRTVLHMLEALQFLEMKVPGGGRETRRVSFRALDIEQIGHVYEGLLDHTARRAAEVVVGLDGKEEPEIALSELNRRRGQPDFVEWLAGETGRSARTIEKVLERTTVDDPLRCPEWEQVAPYAGLVRRDENGEPWIIPTNSLYVTTGAARRQTGTQYTPRSLTESVVEHALAPLVYTGATEGRSPEAWQLKPAGQILDLRVCDFACGSAAFLVAAARYLSARLVEAWEAAQREHGANVQITPYGRPSSGLPDEELIPANPDERGLYALRVVVERCLYGVDRNPLAVEMAKLSLWLLTLQRNRPFTFLDHAIRCGDSLLGVDLKQLSTWSLSGEGKQSVLFDDDLSFAADKREGLMKMQYRPGDQRRLLDVALAKTRRLRAAAVAMGLEEQEIEAHKILDGKRPFHWPVEFPEVFLHGSGFDAIVGNPPFIGGQRITGALGQRYRDYLVEHVAWGQRGSADYVAYFFLRAQRLLKSGGSAGLLATNTIAQGDTREVGLDQMAAQGTSIYRAIPSRKWPGEANLEVAHVWFRKGTWQGPFTLDDVQVCGITSQLQTPGRVTGKPFRLAANAGKSFQGSIVLGMGFVLEPEAAQMLLDKDPRNRDVLFPYLNGEDLNSRWDQSPSRWVINFRAWPIERAMQYPDCFGIVEHLVKPEREKNNRKVYREKWWHFGEKRPELYATIAGLERVLVIPETTKYCTFSFCPTDIVFSHMTKVLVLSDWGSAALVVSSIHEAWARQYSSTLETRLKYITSDCFETFPFPVTLELLEPVGERYHANRCSLMAARREGLTTTYNRFHSPHEVSSDIATLRALHGQTDHAVAAAYGWADLDLGHGFHETKQGMRYTISEAARREVLDRLLALNHERYAQEQVAVGEQPRPKRKPRSKATAQPKLF